MLAVTRVLIGIVWAACGCCIALRIGDEPERRTALVMAICWGVGAAAQLGFHDIYGFAIIAQFVFGAVLLWLAQRYHKLWIWVMAAGAGALFFLHGFLYRRPEIPGLTYLIAGDTLVWGAPLLLAAVAFRNWLRRTSNTFTGPRVEATQS